MNTKTMEQAYELSVYPRRDVVLVSGKGARLYDEEGREYIDCASNVGVSNIGHGHQAVADAIYEQYLALGNCYSMFYNPVRARLAEKLAKLAPGNLNLVFFCNSGAEAIEGAAQIRQVHNGQAGDYCGHEGVSRQDPGGPGRHLGTRIPEAFRPHDAGS